MKGKDLYALMNQARATRALEKIAAAQSGEKPPKLSFVERWVLGVKRK